MLLFILKKITTPQTITEALPCQTKIIQFYQNLWAEDKF